MYLTIEDFDSQLYPEIRKSISRNDRTATQSAINTALALVRSRLSLRYDIAGEYQKTGQDRNGFLLSLLTTIAIYNFYLTQELIPALRRQQYDDALTELDKLQSGQSVLDGVAPAIVPPTDSDNPGLLVATASNPKRARLW